MPQVRRSLLFTWLSSLELTVVLLALSIVLVFAGTLDQVNLGIYAVQEKYFRSFFVFWPLPNSSLSLPLFPGGYLVGGLLFLNLCMVLLVRFKATWRRLGLLITHLGLLLLLLGELISGLLQEDFQLQLTKGETKNYSESFHALELAITDTTETDFDKVVAIPAGLLRKGAKLQHPALPFSISVRDYFANARLRMRPEGAPEPNLASAGFGTRIAVTEVPVTYRPNEANSPAGFIELTTSKGPQGIYLISTDLAMPQILTLEGRTYRLELRAAREYKPFSLTLLELRHELYPGSEIPRNFSSRVRLRSDDGKDDREVLIYMNNPLRYRGLTFYQYQMNEASHFSAFQVVRNPGWLLPYAACALLSVGLLVHFTLSLLGFLGRHRRTA